MIYEGTNFTIEGTFDPLSVCYAEKNAIRLRTMAGTGAVGYGFGINYGGSVVSYQTYAKDGAREAVIDLSDWFRVQQDKAVTIGTLTVYMYDADGETVLEQYAMSYAITAPYNMAHVLRPGVWFDAPSYRSYLNRGFGDYEDVSAPSRMIINPDSSMSVWLANTTYGKIFLYADATGQHETANNSDGAAVVPYNAVAAAVPFPGGESYNVTIDRDACRPLRLFRWQFPNGMTVQHWMQVYNVTDSTANSLELMSQYDNYDIRKGLLQTMEAGMDGLTAYDLWYYGTMVTSSNVWMYRIDTQVWERVSVTTKKNEVTPTTDGKFKQLRLDVALLEHDAI